MEKLKYIKKIIFISEALSAPFDEGLKNVAFSIHRELEKMTHSITITRMGNNTNNLTILQVGLNKLFFNKELRTVIHEFSPDIILYLPEASITFNSFIRAKSLKIMSSSAKVVVLGVQHRSYTLPQELILSKLLKPDLLLLMGKNDERYFLDKGFKVKILSPAVDSIEFPRLSKEEMMKIKEQYDIQNNKTIILHVGHIKANRNIECLLELQKIDHIQVVLVGSTSMKTEHTLKDTLIRAGIKIIDVYVPNIAQLYGIADIYVFPVIGGITGAIDMPLSVLEAMASNLPVITTRFGALPELFREDAGFRYFDTPEELTKIVLGMDINDEINNNIKIRPFSWHRFTDEMIAACAEL